MVIAGTGHRPDKLGGWDTTDDWWPRLVSVAEESLDRYRPSKVVSGGAAGWDLALSTAAKNLEIPLVMAIPFLGQERRWNSFWQGIYNESMEYGEVNILTPGEDLSYDIIRQALLDRNVWMVDNCDMVLAMWNGDSSGGTAHCIRTCNTKGRMWVNLWGKYKVHISHTG